MSLPNQHEGRPIEEMDLTLLESSDLRQLAQTIQGCTCVKSVDVSCPNNQRGPQLQWDTDAVRHFFETLGCLPSLKTIHFKFLGGGDHDNEIPLSLFTAFLSSRQSPCCPNLESFRLVLVGPITCRAQDVNDFSQALSQQRKLRDFRFSCCYFSHEVLNAATNPYIPNSNNIMDSMLYALSTLPLLETVNLKAASKGHLGRIHASSLHTLLCQVATTSTATTTSIKTLCLDNFALDNSHVDCISSALQSNKSGLEDLYLNLSSPGNSGNLLDPNALPDAIQNNKRLQRLQLRLSKQATLEDFLLNTARALRHNKTLKVLGFHGGITITSDIEKEFEKGLESNRTMENLFLPSSCYTDVWREKIDFFLQLNTRGRQRLLEESESMTKQQWIEVFVNASHDISFIYYYMRAASPFL